MPFKHRFQSYQRKSLKEWVQEVKESGLENIFENAFEYQYRVNGTFVVRPVRELVSKGREGSQNSPESEFCVESSQKSQESDDLNKYSEERIKFLEEQIRLLEEQLLKRDQEIRDSRASNNTEELATMTKQLSAQKEESSSLLDQLHTAVEQSQHLQRTLCKYEADLAFSRVRVAESMELAEQVASYEEDLSDLQRENDVLRVENSTLRQSYKDSQEENSRLRQSQKDSQEENSRMRQSQKDSQEAHKRNAHQLQNKLKDLQGNIDILTNINENLCAKDWERQQMCASASEDPLGSTSSGLPEKFLASCKEQLRSFEDTTTANLTATIRDLRAQDCERQVMGAEDILSQTLKELDDDDSLVTQDSNPPENLRKSQDIQAAWNHESHYASNEIQVVNDPRPARKKEEAARKSFLSHKASQNRKHRNRLLADADARLARGRANSLNKMSPKQRTPRVCSASEPSTSEWGYDSEPTSQQDFVDPHLVKELLAMEKRLNDREKRVNDLQQDIHNQEQENEQMRQNIKKKELAEAAKRVEAESIKNC